MTDYWREVLWAVVLMATGIFLYEFVHMESIGVMCMCGAAIYLSRRPRG